MKLRKILLLLISLFLIVFGISNYINNKKNNNEIPITFNLGLKPETLDPHLFSELISLQVDSMIYESLLRLDQNGNISSGVGKIIKETDTKIIFEIKNNAQWSDGSKITANDFVFGFKRALDSKVAAQYSEMLYPIKNAEKYYNAKGVGVDLGIKAKSDKILEIDLERPTPYFKYILTLPISAPLKKEFYDLKGKDFAVKLDAFLFNGPYKIDKISDNEIFLTKNETYWNAKNIKIKKIKAVVVEDFKAVDSMIENNELDMSRVEIFKLNDYKKSKNIDTYINGRIWYLDFNIYDDNFKNMKLRKAISLTINREKYVKEIKQDGSTVAKAIISNVIDGYGEKFRTKYDSSSYFIDNDIQNARKLYKESLEELKKDKFKITLLAGNSSPERIEIQFIAEELRTKLGIDVDVEIVSFKDRLTRTRSGKYEIVLNTWSPKYNDVLTYLNRWNKDEINDVVTTSWSKKKYNNLVDKVSMMVSSNERDKLAAQAEKILIDEAVIAPLYFSVENHYINRKIQGVVRRPITSITEFSYAHMNK